MTGTLTDKNNLLA